MQKISHCLRYGSSSRVTALLRVLGLALVALLSAPARATADCPPLTSGSSFFEVLARHAPGPGPLTDAQILELVQKGVLMPLQVVPVSGPAPLTVEIRWWVYPVENPVRVEFDADGNGVPEWTQSGYEPGSKQRTYTYQREGQYLFTVRIHGRGGQMTVYTAPATVFTPAAFEAELQGRWSSMKAAFRRGDIPAALECIHSESRSRYRDAFTALGSRLVQDVDQIFTPLRFVKHGSGGATYEMLRTGAGITESFDVRFQADTDGIWRLRSF